MRKIGILLTLGLVVSLSPSAQAATNPKAVTAAFNKVLSTTNNSLEALELEYEADIDALDATLAAVTKAAEVTYDNELLAATTLYAPQITAANKKAEDSLKIFNTSNKVKVGSGGGFFGGTNLANFLDCLLDPVTLKKYNRVCSDNTKTPVPGTGTLWPDYGWQKDDVTTIQIFNSAQELVQNGIAAGYIIPLDLLAFDSSRIAYKQALADVATLTDLNGKARTSAQSKRENSVSRATGSRESALTDLDDAYETSRTKLEAQETAAQLALLAAKRATKDAKSFDRAFVVAYKFEYNRLMVNQIADAAWTGDWTFRTIDSILKVNRLAVSGDGIARRYSLASANSFNSAVGNAFTNEPDFRAALKVLTSIYKKTTNTTLKFT